jgi:DNA-binding response OmpR family regulator
MASPSPSVPSNGRELVLVVEDDASIAEIVRRYLDNGGYRVELRSDGTEALVAIAALHPDVIVLDVGLPGVDGVEICRRLRAAGDHTPVLFVTARDDEVDRVVGLELGADDYITKPFSPRELVARVTSALRRVRWSQSGPPAPEPDQSSPTDAGRLRVGQVELDPVRRRVRAGAAEVSLTATEFDLLAYLMRRPGWVFSREQLLTDVWGHAAIAGVRTVDVHVAQLRGKLGSASPLRTVRGIGYAVDDEPA